MEEAQNGESVGHFREVKICTNFLQLYHGQLGCLSMGCIGFQGFRVSHGEG